MLFRSLASRSNHKFPPLETPERAPKDLDPPSGRIAGRAHALAEVEVDPPDVVGTEGTGVSRWGEEEGSGGWSGGFGGGVGWDGGEEFGWEPLEFELEVRGKPRCGHAGSSVRKSEEVPQVCSTN